MPDSTQFLPFALKKLKDMSAGRQNISKFENYHRLSIFFDGLLGVRDFMLSYVFKSIVLKLVIKTHFIELSAR